MNNPFVWVDGKVQIDGALAWEWYSQKGIPPEIFADWINDFIKPGSALRYKLVTDAYDKAHGTNHSETLNNVIKEL